jgi:hypothetical protein
LSSVGNTALRCVIFFECSEEWNVRAVVKKKATADFLGKETLMYRKRNGKIGNGVKMITVIGKLLNMVLRI